jgi:tetratricopeptide (TPR) repeat protein
MYFDKALNIDPNFKDALNTKGRVLNILGDYKEAMISLDKSLAIDANDPSPLKNKGYALIGVGNYKEGYNIS